MLDFRSEYLPLPYAPRSFTAPGEWAYDPNSLVVLAGAGRGRTNAIRNLTYSVQSVDIAPDPADLTTALAGTPADVGITNVIPPGFPESITALTQRVTAEADTPIKQARRSRPSCAVGEFTYSTEPLPGSGFRALENFLIGDRRGYCEQFAGGDGRDGSGAQDPVPGGCRLPARGTARGHLRGLDPGHARVAGTLLRRLRLGALRTDSVRSDRHRAVVDDPGRRIRRHAVRRPERPAERRRPVRLGGPVERCRASTDRDGAAGSSVDWVRTLVITAIGLLVLVVLAAPATIRVRRRNSRLNAEGEPAEQVESAWAEIRDTVVDHGGSWPGGSPRAIGTEVADRLEQPESASMGQIATLVERSRYARSVDLYETGTDLPTMTTEIRRGIAAPRSRLRRILAVVFPRSVFPRPFWRSIFRRGADRALRPSSSRFRHVTAVVAPTAVGCCVSHHVAEDEPTGGGYGSVGPSGASSHEGVRAADLLLVDDVPGEAGLRRGGRRSMLVSRRLSSARDGSVVVRDPEPALEGASSRLQQVELGRRRTGPEEVDVDGDDRVEAPEPIRVQSIEGLDDGTRPARRRRGAVALPAAVTALSSDQRRRTAGNQPGTDDLGEDAATAADLQDGLPRGEIEKIGERPNRSVRARATLRKGLEAGFVPAPLPALFHLVHEALAVGSAGGLGRPGPAGRLLRIRTGADVLPGVDSGDGRGHHDDEANHTQKDLGRHAGDQQRETDEEADTGNGCSAAMDAADTGAAKRVDQLRILGGERCFHLLE